MPQSKEIRCVLGNVQVAAMFLCHGVATMAQMKTRQSLYLIYAKQEN